MRLILRYNTLARAALEHCSSLQELFEISAREQIGRAKSVPEEEYQKVYEEIERQMEAEIEAIAAKGGQGE